MLWLVYGLIFKTILIPPCPHGNGGAVFVYKNIKDYFNKSHKLSFQERIRYWSSLFLNTPYSLDPLGEGKGKDTDPFFNPCYVDCETFVEQTLSLSFANNFSQALKWIKAMRYHNCNVNLKNKFFTMAGSWIPGNLALGYLKPLSLLKTKEMKRFVRPEGKWREPFKSRLIFMGELAPRGWQRVKYVPLDWILDQLSVLKKYTPMVAMVVAVKQLGNPFMITHMGLVLKNKKGLFFRHASSLHKRVMDVPLKDYVEFLKEYEEKGFRPVAGLVFYQIIYPQKEPCRSNSKKINKIK